jgi:tetratricopeptide (TPR) repeat protein
VLRQALRLSVRTFAGHLGVAVRTVAKWEAGGRETVPRPDTQAILDTALSQASLEVQQRFGQLLQDGGTAVSQSLIRIPAGVGAHDYDSWADDLDRTLVCLGRQEFTLARNLLERWLRRFEPNSQDTLGMHLYGRSLRLHGDVQQDQGRLDGPLSARQSYRAALRVFTELDAGRRVAQLELQLVVLDEMSGLLERAAWAYQQLVDDERLSQRDRTRAYLWVGTALSKRGLNDEAEHYIQPAIQDFEMLEEPQDWSVAHQKLALARRGAGDLRGASQAIEVALANRTSDAPMQRVRLDTAHAHILLSDKATRDSGLATLDRTAAISAQYGMMHQLRSIEDIRHSYEQYA